MSTDAARAVPGVVDIITAADAPVNEYGLTMRDQPALVGVDHTGAAAVDAAVSRWEADQLAVVLAETRTAAPAGRAAAHDPSAPADGSAPGPPGGRPHSSSGLGRRPFTPVTRVRIPYGVRNGRRVSSR